MKNYLDVPRDEADEILVHPKTAPIRDFKIISGGPSEKLEMAVGVLVNGGLYKRSLTIQLICHQSLRPFRQNFKFSLFYQEHGRPQRVYQLDTTNVPICDEGEHDWPHQHVGRDRIYFGQHFPINFDQSIAYFCKATNVKFDDHIDSPFDFKLRPST